MRLGGWYRIGITLSCVWFLIGGFWGNEIALSQGDFAVAGYRLCLSVGGSDWDKCKTTFHQEWTSAIAGHWWTALIVATVPILIGWLLMYGVIRLFRWIKAGFKAPAPLRDQ